MHKCASAVFAVVVLVAGCGGGSKPEAAKPPPINTPDISNVEINGDRSAPVNVLAMEAIADLQTYWGDEYSGLYGEDYEPLAGGLYASTPDSESGPECASGYGDVQGNAFYCRLDDSVTWDADDLLPNLQSRFGDFVIPIVLAHEWGHAIQARSNFTARTVTKELQADCFAGAWSKHAKDDRIFDVSDADLDAALAGILELRDQPGESKTDPQAHGSGFDRVGAFQDGFDNGLDKCKEYRDDDPMVLELPFEPGSVDEAQGGNAPYDEIVNGVPYDLEDFWTQVYPQITDGQAWEPVKGLEPFDPDDPPMCDGEPVNTSLIYCQPDDFIGWDNVNEMPDVYDSGGDYAVATLLAAQYGAAALTRLQDDSDEKTATLRADCFAGSYTSSVILHDRARTSSYSISPGDLDEAIKALLVLQGQGEVDGNGFARVRAFREGVINGVDACLDYQT